MDLTEAPAAIRRFIAATNAADSEAFIAAFTDDATLVDWGRSFAGRDGVRDWDRTDNIGVQTQFDLLSIEPGGDADTYVATISVRGNGFNGTGPMVFQVRGDLIRSLQIG